MAVRFKLDENLPRAAQDLLISAGHSAETALAEGLGGRSDRAVPDASVSEGRVLVTFDLDFADIRNYPPADHRGLWVLRPVAQSVDNTLFLLRRALTLLESEAVDRRRWVIESGRVRIRK